MSTLAAELENDSPSFESSLFSASNLVAVNPGQRHSKELQYWKLCEIEDCQIHYQQKGWVVLGPALQPRTAVEWSQYQSTKHATPLTKYGRWASGEVFNPPTRFGPLIRQGGIVEIPLDQAIAYKWHLKPQLVALIPALANVEVLLCEHGCATKGPRARTFNDSMSRDKHYRVMHEEIVGPTLIGRQMRDMATSGNGQTATPIDYEALGTAIAKSLPTSEAPQAIDYEKMAVAIALALKGNKPEPTVVRGGSND